MICSISTSDATASTSRSNSNWLDRLHSSRGFSLPAHHHNLDHFLSPASDPNPNPSSLPPLENELPDPLPPKPASDLRRHKKLPPPPPPPPPGAAENEQQLFSLVSGVLSELFVMGGPPVARALKAQKSVRKQPNPRVCVPSISASIDGCGAAPATSPPSSADNSVAEAKKSRTKVRRKRGRPGGPVRVDLSAYSRTDVTVIDTSCSGWKSEKVIFRKGSMWKVRDKKVWNLNRKKRKLGLVGKLAHEKEKAQLVAEPKISAEEEILASEGISPIDKAYAPEKARDEIPISIRRFNDVHQSSNYCQKFARSPRSKAAKGSASHLNATASRKNAVAGLKAPTQKEDETS